MEFTDKAVKCGTDKKGDLLITLELGGSGREIDAEYIMVNNFAFGGVNTSLVIRKAG